MSPLSAGVEDLSFCEACREMGVDVRGGVCEDCRKKADKENTDG